MTAITAQEQARKAAQRRAAGLATQGSATTAVNLAADAASGVWEPLLRDLLAVAEKYLDPHDLENDEAAAIRRAADALRSTP